MHHCRLRFDCLLLGAFFLAVTTHAQPDAPLIPANSTVVLFPSLAGDVESERTYRDQITAWISVVEKTEAQKLAIFSEQQFQISHTLKSHTFKPARESFLSSAPQLTSGTNPLVVIAWGHGGMQGQTPVFHVRGPRLTPADFKEFASRTTAPSTWVLLFRGSGQFARELAGPNRRIISSERDSLFRNDPIGMSVLLKLLRHDPATPLAALADVFGSAVAKWYDEQNLARTEEPALWLESAEARALVHDAQPLESASTPNKPALSSKPAATTTNTASWPISPVRPDDYPDDDAVVLSLRMAYTLGASPAITAEHEQYVQVLTPEGKGAGDFDLSYSPPYETLEILDCEIRRADGRVTRVDPDEIRETAEESESPTAPKTYRKFFSIPDVSPGAIIHVRYLREWQKFPLPHVTLTLPLSDDAPVRETSLQVNVPKESPFHFRFEHLTAPEPKITRTDYAATYTWQLGETPAWNPEPLSLPHGASALMISTFPDWKAFAGWYERIIRFADQGTSEITNRAVELTRGASSDREKIEALYNYVTGLRYVAVPLGVNSFRPHAAAGVLRNQFGDCKDKANLLNTLLRSQGIDAHLVLVPRFSQAYDTMPGFAFNHAISRVRLGDNFLWLDTTDDVCRFGTLPPGDHGRRVLVVDGESHALTTLPRSDPRQHTLDLRVNVDGADDHAFRAKAVASGYFDYTLRTRARMVGKRTTVPLWNADFRLLNATFALEKQTFTSPSDLSRDFTLDARGKAVSVVDPQAGSIRVPVFLPGEWNLALHARREPLFLNDGYPMLIRQHVEVTLPPGANGLRLPPNARHVEGPLRWSVAASTRDNVLLVKLECELVEAELSREQTRAFQEQVRSLFNAVSRPVAFSKTKTHNE